jgi:hypothetical protein
MVPVPLGALQVFAYRRVLALRPEEHPIQDFAPAIPQMFNVARRLAVPEEPVVSPTPVQVEIRKRVRAPFFPSSLFIKLTQIPRTLSRSKHVSVLPSFL